MRLGVRRAEQDHEERRGFGVGRTRPECGHGVRRRGHDVHLPGQHEVPHRWLRWRVSQIPAGIAAWAEGRGRGPPLGLTLQEVVLERGAGGAHRARLHHPVERTGKHRVGPQTAGLAHPAEVPERCLTQARALLVIKCAIEAGVRLMPEPPAFPQIVQQAGLHRTGKRRLPIPRFVEQWGWRDGFRGGMGQIVQQVRPVRRPSELGAVVVHIE